MFPLTFSEIINASELFQANTDGLPKHFHANFDKKLIDDKALKLVITNKSNTITSPVGCQSSNGLAGHTCQTIIKISRAYITEK